MKATISGLRYDTDSAMLIANDAPVGWPRTHGSGRVSYLYRTANGSYFVHHMTLWFGERDYIEPIAEGAARYMWNDLVNKAVDWDVAFPDHPARDA